MGSFKELWKKIYWTTIWSKTASLGAKWNAIKSLWALRKIKENWYD